MGLTPSGKEFKRAIERLNVYQLGAGRLLGVDGRTIRTWIADDSRILNAVAILIRLAIAGQITLQDIEAVADRLQHAKRK